MKAQLRTAAERALAKVVLSLPRPLLVRMSGGERVVVDADPLDEQVQMILFMAERMGRKGPEQLGVDRSRRDMEVNAKVLDVAPRPMARIRDHAVEDGRFRLRTYVPRALANATDAPALVYLHGGGFVVGSIDSHDGIARFLADETPCVVASVDYRLAPEHKFPAGVEDAVDAFKWVHGEAKRLGIDPSRIAVGGDSAGGNLSAVVCQEQKKRGGPMPAFQLLIYPATDCSCAMESHRLFASGFFLEASGIAFYLDCYLRGPEDVRDPRASPLFAEDFAGLPPALVVTAGFDPLRDEGEEYAKKLRAAGVKVEHKNDAGMFHGYFSCGGRIHGGMEALLHAARALRRGLAG